MVGSEPDGWLQSLLRRAGIAHCQAPSVAEARRLIGDDRAYQPIRDRTGRVLGHEALLRVPEATSLSAGQVVERARSQGRTGDLLRGVLGEVVRDAPHLEGAIFVNLFWGDLHEEVLRQTASPVRSLADRLVLEVAETSVRLSGPDDTPARVADLRDAGYRICLDGVDTGRSSLASLGHVPADFAKLDVRLTRGIAESVSAQHLVLALARYCAHLEVQIVAKGIEAAVERSALASLGCRYLQGPLLGEPRFCTHGDVTKEVG